MNYDLFSDATVTLDDVELWLSTIPRFTDDNRQEPVLNYITNYDVVNKIIRAKVNKSFYQLCVTDKFYLSDSIKPLIKNKYRPCSFEPYGR